jgi:hypothetical protein
MLVQLNRHDDHRALTVTATDLPLNQATTKSQAPVVAVFGQPGQVAGLAIHQPSSWAIRRPRDLDDVRLDDIVLFAHSSLAEVAAARAVLPRRTRIVAVVDAEAPAELVADVLTAGADVCVRGGQPAILASHLVACRRRQLADRWSNLQSRATLRQA